MLNLLPFPYRMLALALLVGAVWFHGWTKGVAHEEKKFDAYRAEQMAQAATELSKRLAEKAELQRKNEGIANDLQKAKTARAADAVATGNKLRDFHAALSRAVSADASACPGITDPRPTIASECAAALRTLDDYAKGLADQARGLQDYTSKVCLIK